MLVLKLTKIEDGQVEEKRFRTVEAAEKGWWKALATGNYSKLVMESGSAPVRSWRVTPGVAGVDYYQAEGFGR